MGTISCISKAASSSGLEVLSHRSKKQGRQSTPEQRSDDRGTMSGSWDNAGKINTTTNNKDNNNDNQYLEHLTRTGPKRLTFFTNTF